MPLKKRKTKEDSRTRENEERLLSKDSLFLIECLARDNYSRKEIAARFGVPEGQFLKLVKRHPELKEALRNGKEIVDYKVENALLKSALGYKTKEVKIITTIRKGVVVETLKESQTRDVVPNIGAIQMWLHNRLPQKWKKNPELHLGISDDEDSTIQVSIIRAGNKNDETETDNDEINESVLIEVDKPQKANEKKNERKRTE